MLVTVIIWNMVASWKISDIMPCILLKANKIFGNIYRIHLQRSAWHLLSCWYLAPLIFLPWRWGWYVRPKRRFNFKGIHGVISQKITTAVIFWNSTKLKELVSVDLVLIMDGEDNNNDLATSLSCGPCITWRRQAIPLPPFSLNLNVVQVKWVTAN
jgi:hypothetical protein